MVENDFCLGVQANEMPFFRNCALKIRTHAPNA